MTTRSVDVIDRIDPASGRTVRQFATTGAFQHIYFTSSAFSSDGRRAFLIGDEGNGSPNLYELAIDGGTLTRLTKNTEGYQSTYMYPGGVPGCGFAKPSPSYCQATDQLLYVEGGEVRLVDVASREERTIHTLPAGASPAYTHLSSDGRYACVPYIPVALIPRGEDHRTWFEDTFRAVNDLSGTTVLVIATDGSGVVDRFHEPGWVTHVQFRPGDADVLLFNHEGWTLAEQRMWLRRGGRVAKLRDEAPDKARGYAICHEVWTRDGAGAIYHGEVRVEGQARTFVGRVDADTGAFSEPFFPRHYDGHCVPSSDASIVVTDGSPEEPSLFLIRSDWRASTVELEELCRHDSGWTWGELYQDVHPHPVFSPDDRHVLFTSDARNALERGHVYLVETGLGG